MTIVRTLWNVGLLILGLLAGYRILPKLMASLSPDAFKHFWTAWVGVEGLGIALLIVLCLASLGTWAWRKVGRAPRLIYLLAGVLFVAGACVSAVVDHRMVGHVFWADYVTFVAVFAVFAFPIVCLGVGYPGLILRLVRRSTGRSTRA